MAFQTTEADVGTSVLSFGLAFGGHAALWLGLGLLVLTRRRAGAMALGLPLFYIAHIDAVLSPLAITSAVLVLAIHARGLARWRFLATTGAIGAALPFFLLGGLMVTGLSVPYLTPFHSTLGAAALLTTLLGGFVIARNRTWGLLLLGVAAAIALAPIHEGFGLGDCLGSAGPSLGAYRNPMAGGFAEYAGIALLVGLAPWARPMLRFRGSQIADE